jgi:hypothetical protein
MPNGMRNGLGFHQQLLAYHVLADHLRRPMAAEFLLLGSGIAEELEPVGTIRQSVLFQKSREISIGPSARRKDG